MDSYDADKIKHVVNNDVIRKLLTKYFIDKNENEGQFSIDRPIYPPILQDMISVIPVLANKIEIMPYAIDLDPIVGRLTLGWNLYVLGNYRMFLGETFHNSLSDFARQIRSGFISISPGSSRGARRQTTPRKIIAFITRVLSSHDGGYVDLTPPSRPVRQNGEPNVSYSALHSIPQQFQSRPGGY